VRPVATTSAQHWQDNPIADGEQLSIDESAYPDKDWQAGVGFVYEPGNGAVEYYVSSFGSEPPVGFGGKSGKHASPRVREKEPLRFHMKQQRADAIPTSASPSTDGVSMPALAGGDTIEQALVRSEEAESDWLLTVPGIAMSAAQREAMMRMPAFSDDGDPLFGPAVWKYREANANGAERAVATGVVDAFGRPLRPMFAETDGAPADGDGRPMAESLHHLGESLDKAAGAVGPKAVVAALQGAVNDLGDAQVKVETPRDGKQAKRLMPRLLPDGIVGPKTGQAVRLALHHAGPKRVAEALDARLRLPT
jgi:hypothetical protein